MKGIEMGRPVEILLVDDSRGDLRLTIEALKVGNFNYHVGIAYDGVEAMAFLRQEGVYADAPRPDVVLLDLNMPRKNGHEVLEEMKQNPNLRPIPVVVLTTSEAEQDIVRAYQLHASCYLTKPMDFDQFMNVVRSIEDFWLTVVKLPCE